MQSSTAGVLKEVTALERLREATRTHQTHVESRKHMFEQQANDKNLELTKEKAALVNPF